MYPTCLSSKLCEFIPLVLDLEDLPASPYVEENDILMDSRTKLNMEKKCVILETCLT